MGGVRYWKAAGYDHLVAVKHLVNGELVDRPGMENIIRRYEARKAAKAGTSIDILPKPLDDPILPGLISCVNHSGALEALISLDTCSLGPRSLITRAMVDSVASAGGDVVITPQDVTYSAVEGSLFHSSGSVRLTVAIIFDKINNDVEVLTDLELHIVETLPRQIDCSIANADIARRAILVRIPKTQHSQQDQQVIDLFNNLSIDQLLININTIIWIRKPENICKGVHFMCVR